MATRRQAREWVVQLLFQLDMNPEPLEKAFGPFWEDKEADVTIRGFTETLVRGVRENLSRIDETIKTYAENWDINRMKAVDRNVLRMAVYEMLFCEDIPPIVAINEAVDIAKYFSTPESGRFVNGILDRVLKEVKRPARGAGPKATPAEEKRI